MWEGVFCSEDVPLDGGERSPASMSHYRSACASA